MLKIHSIIIYPIKSLGGINVSKIMVEPPGLQYDRRFMLVDEHNNFITQRTRPELTRFQLSTSFSRATNPAYHTEKSKISSFADSLPVLLCSEASFNYMDSLLDQPLDWRRFRPNIIVSNQTAFEEDTWHEISIGSYVKLFGAKPCARCQLINVNPNDGTSDSNILKALSQTRKFENKVYFGQQFVPISLGEIKIDDLITIHKRKDAIF